ncbi:hypothetical protein EV669_103289 [Gulbenkiania mobilis]|uniref:Uncharacterized protein n=1 Tax=Gulbenkiania mobilis TaxID=397457 RepID=A0ABY2CYM8_GULMO|nr:hypothetical protein EV669_103289 [Gulbenkiania mobilis]
MRDMFPPVWIQSPTAFFFEAMVIFDGGSTCTSPDHPALPSNRTSSFRIFAAEPFLTMTLQAEIASSIS